MCLGCVAIFINWLSKGPMGPRIGFIFVLAAAVVVGCVKVGESGPAIDDTFCSERKMQTYADRLTALRTANAACSTSADCALVGFNCNCPGYFTCGSVAVAAQAETDFRSAAQTIFDACYAEVRCVGCASCLLLIEEARCVAGLCEVNRSWPPDAGLDDGGSVDAGSSAIPDGGSVNAGDECDAIAGPYCSNDGKYRCKLEKARRESDSCAVDSDCSLVQFNCNCAGYGQCPAASVARTSESAFRSEAMTLLDRCLTEPGACISCGTCGAPRQEAICVSGACQVQIHFPDAGP